MKFDRFDAQLDALVANAVNDHMRDMRQRDLKRYRHRTYVMLSIFSIIAGVLVFWVHPVYLFYLVWPVLGNLYGLLAVESEMKMLRIAGALKEAFQTRNPSTMEGDTEVKA